MGRIGWRNMGNPKRKLFSLIASSLAVGEQIANFMDQARQGQTLNQQDASEDNPEIGSSQRYVKH